VHIATPAGQGFRRDQHPSASVSLTPAGQGVSPQQARAIRFLVASAVAGLNADDVSVIDAESGLVLGGDDAGFGMAGDPDRTAQLKRNVERLLEARVGPGRAIVELTIDTMTDREQITERRFDPDTRVAISSETEERTGQSNDTRPGSVTVASNLPAGDAAAGDGRSSSQNSETRERVNYEVSETQREILRGPGGIKRLSVAVLVDGVSTTDASGAETWAPRPEEEMASLRELVSSAVGFDEARGDVITLKSMPFEPVALAGSDAYGGSLLAGIDLISIAQLAVLAVVALILGLFVVRPILAPKALPAPASSRLPELAGPGGSLDLALPGSGDGSGQAFTGEIDDGDDFFPGGFPAVNSALPALSGDSSGDTDFDPSDPVSRLRRLISERRDETVEILRNWMDESEEKV
jgi:flagellar M-ring protein FliF